MSSQPVHLIPETAAKWELDGLRVLEYRWTKESIQILFSATPDVAPTFLASRAKGRLDHALREAKIAEPFSRKVSVRAIGENTQREVEAYVASQVESGNFADPRFAAELAKLTIINENVDLSKPTESARGRYWYNLHLVLVVDDRHSIANLHVLSALRDEFVSLARKKSHLVSRLSVMPDHLHAALRGRIDESPCDIVSGYQNGLASVRNLSRIWRDSFYVGTFGDYAMAGIRSALAANISRSSP